MFAERVVEDGSIAISRITVGSDRESSMDVLANLPHPPSPTGLPILNGPLVVKLFFTLENHANPI